MSPVIRISDNLHQRLEKHAVGFDTPANVIERLLDTVEGVDPIAKPEKVASEASDILPIKLEPEDVDSFKEMLLEKQKASIEIIYNDGNTETKPWNASRFTEDSGVIANLRSRKEFRQGAWQELGIKEVIVSINSENPADKELLFRSNESNKIDMSIIPEIYNKGMEIYDEDLSISLAVKDLVEDYNMNEDSAKMYIQAIQSMMVGDYYQRTINGSATEYFLEKIYKNFGISKLKCALSSIKKHLDYQETTSNGKLNNIREIYNKFLNLC